MALTPSADKTAFWNRIRGDPYTMSRCGLTGKDDAAVARLMRKQRTVDDDDLNNENRFILIFDTPANEAAGPFAQTFIQVDILAPNAKQHWADEILEQIVALCGPHNECGWTVNGRVVDRVVPIGELTSAAGYYRCGVRFYYYSATPTKIKTL